MPRVLMLAHWFPPCRRWPTAGRRVEGFARHLPEHGWEAVVVAPDLGAHGLCDCGADHDAPVEGLDVRRFALRPALAARLTGGVGAGGSSAQHEPSPTLAGTARSLFESRGAWLTQAAAEMGRILAAGGVDAIWTTSSPHSSILVGAWTQARRKVSWVADLRDPIDDVIVPTGAHPAAQRLLRRMLIKPALRRATRVVAATRASAAADEASLGRHVDWAYSGFEDSWLAQAERARRDAETRPGDGPAMAVLTGAIYDGSMDLAPLVTGLALASQRGHHVALQYMGEDGSRVTEAAAEVGFGDVVDLGFRPFPEVLGALATSSINLLLEQGVASTRIPGKVFEYLAAGRPIVCIPGSNPELEQLLHEAGIGVAARRPEDVADAVDRAIALPMDSAGPNAADQLRSWSASTGAGRLATVLNEAINRGTS